MSTPDLDATTIVPRTVPGVQLGRGPEGQPSLATHDLGSVVALDPVGLALWEMCDGETTVAEMVEALLLLFHAERAVVLDDVWSLLHSLEQAEMLRLGRI